MKKRIITIILALTMTLAFLSGCGKKVKDIDIEKVKEDIISSCELEEMRDATEDEISILYDFGEIEYENMVLSISQNPVIADQITIIEAKSEDDVDEIKEVVQQQLESRKSTFDGYAPDEVAKYDGAEVKVNGKYVFAVVCNDNNEAEKVFDNAFKE